MAGWRRPAAALLALGVLQHLAAGREDPFGAAEKAAAAAAAALPDRVYLVTQFGSIPVKLYKDAAPETARLVAELAEKGCSGCKFYRNEARPWVSPGCAGACRGGRMVGRGTAGVASMRAPAGRAAIFAPDFCGSACAAC